MAPGHSTKTKTADASNESASVLPYSRWIGDILASRKMTAAELGDKAGLGRATIYGIWSGRIRNPQKSTIDKVARAVGEQAPRGAARISRQETEIEGLGNLEDFDPHDAKDFPSGPGVYVFYDISERPIYVGQSDELGRRLRSYHEKFWFKSPIVESASYIRVKDDKLRRQIEKILIRFLKNNAVLNKQHVNR